MSGVNVGLSGSYGSSSGTTTQDTQATSNTHATTDFNSMLKELVNNTQTSTTALPRWARLGAKQNYESDLSASGTAKDFLTSLLTQTYGGDGSGGGGKFGAAIDQMFAGQLAKARTGDATQTGVARQGFREGEGLAQAENDVLGLGTNAAVSLLDKANPNNSLGLIGAFAPKTTVTKQNRDQTQNANTVSDSTTNSTQNVQGTQDSSNWGVGGSVGCCFIFLEAYNGTLPWFVRRCRDEFTSGPRRAGYTLLAAHLVPRMKASKLWRQAVNWLMVKPMSAFGGWLYSEPRHSYGWLWGPVTAFWFAVFANLGKQIEASNEAK